LVNVRFFVFNEGSSEGVVEVIVVVVVVVVAVVVVAVVVVAVLVILLISDLGLGG